MTEQRLVILLEAAIREAVEDGYVTFITGMAKGVDILAAEIVLRLREGSPQLKLICALPYEGFGLHWGGGWTERFQKVLAQADMARYICKGFSYASYQRRNEWLVDHSSRVIAVFNGEDGGTKNTINYAKKRASHV